MWNNHHALNMVSTLLIGTVAVAAVYVVGSRLAQPPFFPIKEINIRVHDNADRDDQDLLNVTYEQIERLTRDEIKGNFLSVDLTEVRAAFVKLPWVRDAKVNRQWPHGLNVTLEEHQALAYWGSHALVNTYGEVFRVSIERDLPVFTGPKEANAQEVADQYRKFNHILAPLQQSAVEINLTPRYAWRLRLNTGTVLELGRDEIEARLARYVMFYHHNMVQFTQEEPLAYVDLRYPNGFAIRVPEAKQHAPRKSDSRKQA